MKINPAMVILAREYRGITQEDLARQLFVSQARIAKIEGGILDDLPDTLFNKMCAELNFPPEFFQQEEELLGFGSSAYFYRKKAEITASDRKRIHGMVNLLRIHLKRVLDFVEIDGKRKLPSLDIEQYGQSPAKVAQALRAFWSLPDGPIKNITSLIESAGVVIIPCNFQSRSMDATSIRFNELPPVIFINSQIPGDRWRFTLAHELAHLVMHDVPKEEMEDEADCFASEFLMPEKEMRPQFSRLGDIRLQDLVNLKPYWKTSIGSILMRACDLGFVHDSKKRYMWSLMSKWGWRMQEPEPIPREDPSIHKKIIDFFLSRLQYSTEDLAKLLKISLRDLIELHASAFPDEQKRMRLRIVS